MKLNSVILKEVAEFASDIEKRFNVCCIVVHNKYRIPFAGMEFTFSLIILPFKDESKEVFDLKTGTAYKEYQKSIMSNRRAWHCYFCRLYDVQPWFSRFIDRKERFPLMDMAAGADFISPVVYGKKHMLRLQKEAEDFFGQGIIGFWKKEAVRQRKEKHKKHKELYRKEVIYCRERRKLLNRYELEELKKLVLFVHEKCQEEKISLIVALDGSGRPIGKALEWYGIACPVIHMDPRHMRAINFKNADEAGWLLEALKKEFPEIHLALFENPGSVLFVDDQTGYGHTGKSLDSMVKLFSGENVQALNYAVMTQFAGNNTPSWLRRRDIQGLQPAPEKSLRAIEAPTRQSRRFYNQLRKIVLSWK